MNQISSYRRIKTRRDVSFSRVADHRQFAMWLATKVNSAPLGMRAVFQAWLAGTKQKIGLQYVHLWVLNYWLLRILIWWVQLKNGEQKLLETLTYWSKRPTLFIKRVLLPFLSNENEISFTYNLNSFLYAWLCNRPRCDKEAKGTDVHVPRKWTIEVGKGLLTAVAPHQCEKDISRASLCALANAQNISFTNSTQWLIDLYKLQVATQLSASLANRRNPSVSLA